ncbi:MAG: endolytic transglycosylase MltG, partial [Gammaproteobacteria bacterium]
EYEIKPGVTPLQFLDQLVAGQVIEYSLTVVEGWTFRQLRQEIEKHPSLTKTLINLSDSQLMEKLGWPGEHPEGRFYPDSYHFPKGATDASFYQRAYRTMQDYLDKEWVSRDPNLPLKTPYEALIMASIVERETAVPSERPTIAGVFLRRLQAGMKLQTDPTVIYGLGIHFDGNLHRRDLEKDTPYNTYTRTGLPPTPIALPSAAAIHAVLHPEQGNALYFVARGDGSHEFTDNLMQHNKAVQKYQVDPHKPKSHKP